MTKVYCVFLNSKIIAVHDEKKVVQMYCKDIYDIYHIESEIMTIDKKELNKNIYTDLYLIRYGSSYIQSCYYGVAKYDDEQFLYDLNYSKDVLIRLLEFEKNEKKSKHLRKSIEIIEKEIYRYKNTVKSPIHLDELHKLRQSYLTHID